MNACTPWVIGVVLALSFVLLMLAFRSVVVPATAIVMNLLSVGAAYGNWYLPAWLEWLPRLNIEGPRSAREVPEPAADAALADPHRERLPDTPVYGAITGDVAANPG